MRTVPGYIRGVALGLPIYLTAIHLWTWVLYAPRDIKAGTLDFRQCYTAARMLKDGHGGEMYDYSAQQQYQNAYVSPQSMPLPFVSPAYEAWFLEPFAHFPFLMAYFVFLAVNVTAVIICGLLLRKWFANIGAVYRWLPVAMFAGFLPIADCLIHGQDSILLTLCLVGAFVLLTQEREALAGALCGLAMFKFSLILPLVALFLIWRKWRFVAGFAGAAIPITGLGFVLTGVFQQKLYAITILSIAGWHTPVPLSLFPIHWEVMANIHGLMLNTVGIFSANAAKVATLVCSGALFGWAAFRAKGNSANRLLVAIPISILVSHHTYMHDLSSMILPIVVLLHEYLPAEYACSDGRWQARSAALLYAAPIMISWAPHYFYFVSIAVAAVAFLQLNRANCDAELSALGMLERLPMEAVPISTEPRSQSPSLACHYR